MHSVNKRPINRQGKSTESRFNQDTSQRFETIGINRGINCRSSSSASDGRGRRQQSPAPQVKISWEIIGKEGKKKKEEEGTLFTEEDFANFEKDLFLHSNPKKMMKKGDD